MRSLTSVIVVRWLGSGLHGTRTRSVEEEGKRLEKSGISLCVVMNVSRMTNKSYKCTGLAKSEIKVILSSIVSAMKM